MYAVIEVAGMQCKVAGKDKIRVPKLDMKPGESLELDHVLLIVDEDKVNVGKPLIANAKVKATVLAHGKADKVKVFKKKRRKNYKVLKGHRQGFTEIRIDSIGMGSEKKDSNGESVPKKAASPKAAPKTAAVKENTEKKTPSKPETTEKKSSSQEKEIKG